MLHCYAQRGHRSIAITWGGNKIRPRAVFQFLRLCLHFRVWPRSIKFSRF